MRHADDVALAVNGQECQDLHLDLGRMSYIVFVLAL